MENSFSVEGTPAQIETNTETDHRKNSFMTDGWMFWLVFVFAFIALIYFFVTNVVFKCIKVVGISMQPTINASVDDDRDEVHCDYVYYNTLKNETINDIVVINNHGNTYADQSEPIYYLIKRVVATEGQTIRFFVKDTEPNQITDPNTLYYDYVIFNSDGTAVDMSELFNTEMYFTYGEIYDQSQSHPFFKTIFDALQSTEQYDYTVPNGYVFVMGDNRNNSLDSRFFGAVKNEDIEGVVVLHLKYGTENYKKWYSIFGVFIFKKYQIV